MSETRKCPLCYTVMTYDATTGIYTCPLCGYKEHNPMPNAIQENSCSDDSSGNVMG